MLRVFHQVSRVSPHGVRWPLEGKKDFITIAAANVIPSDNGGVRSSGTDEVIRPDLTKVSDWDRSNDLEKRDQYRAGDQLQRESFRRECRFRQGQDGKLVPHARVVSKPMQQPHRTRNRVSGQDRFGE